MGLFTPAWKTDNHKKSNKAVAAVMRVSDQGELVRIARTAPLGEVRAAAASRIVDQDALFEIAVADNSPSARKAAIERMDDGHLVRFAGKARTPEVLRAVRSTNPEDDEVFAAGRISSAEALADLYLLLKQNSRARCSVKNYPYWSYKAKCEAAVEERMGEAESAIVVRKLMARGEEVDPVGFLGSRIRSPKLRIELGLGDDKAELIERFKEKPTVDSASLLWPILDDDEKAAMQHVLADWLQGLMRGRNTLGVPVMDFVDFIDDQGLLAKLLVANPNHEVNLLELVKRINDPDVIRQFLDMLDSRDVYTYPAINKPPEPSENNFIIHTSYADDHWAKERVKTAVEDRLRFMR